jgi:uncharacterized protein YcaQ
VVLAITPKSLEELKRESRELLEEVTEQVTVLPSEDAEMLRRRLYRLKPQPVPEFSRSQAAELAEKIRLTHEAVRGPVDDPEWPKAVREAVAESGSPRALARTLLDRLETHWWRSC